MWKLVLDAIIWHHCKLVYVELTNKNWGFYNTVEWGSIKNSDLTLNSHTFHGNSLNSVYNSHVTRCLGLDWSLKVSVPQLQNFWNVFTTLDTKVSCLEMKLWLKVVLFRHVLRHAKTSVWFVNVKCYCSDRRNSNNFFLTTKFPFVQSCSMLMGQLWTTLNVFISQKRIRNEPIVFAFGKERL